MFKSIRRFQTEMIHHYHEVNKTDNSPNVLLISYKMMVKLK